MIGTIVSLEAVFAAWVLAQKRRAAVLEKLTHTNRESAPLRLLSRSIASVGPVASRTDRKIAAHLSRCCRSFANTNAFELLVLRAVVHIRNKAKGGTK